jgi:hypothetical protein
MDLNRRGQADPGPEERAALAWALANPAPVVGLPLRPEVRAVLDHLHFASGMRGHGLGRALRREEPLLVGRTVLSDAEFTAWAGIEVPEVVTPWAHRRVCTRLHGHDDDHVTVFWLPADADVAEFTWQQAEASGAPTLTVDLHDGKPAAHPELQATRFRSAPGGWTAVTVGRSVVGVQRIDPDATRIGWVREDLPRPLAFVLHVTLLPTPAVELVLRGPGLPFAR